MSSHNPFRTEQHARLPDGVTRDRFCSPSVSLESCHAILITVKSLEDVRCEYMFWRDDAKRIACRCQNRQRIRDLRPGDKIVVDGWLRQVGVRVLFEPVSQELFDLHGEGERVEVQTPAYVIDSGDGTQRVLQPGVALRYDNNASLAQEQPDSLPMASSDPEGEEVQP